MPPLSRRLQLHAVMSLSTAGIFLADLQTPADNVSICFAYAIPIVLGIQLGGRVAFAYAAVATLLSIAGSLIQPGGPTSVVFFANRVIAIGTQWMMALLVHYRLEAEAALRRGLETERARADMQRRLVAILSHEVKTPLTTIDGQAYRLTKLSRTLEPDDMVARAGKIRSAVRRISDIVERIELSSSAEETEVTPALAPVDPRAVIAEAAQSFVDQPGRPGVELDIEGLPERILADATLLQHVFVNLLSNAMKYSPDGGSARVTGRVEGDMAVISVSDRGIGIDPSELDKVFVPYYRGRNSGGIGGAGIGLYLVERYVAAHGGRVDVDSRPGAGTTVAVRLPLHGPRTVERHATPQDDPVHRG